ncbi:hypothetical protein DXG01_015130, partial [Tephrocybe rancida]
PLVLFGPWPPLVPVTQTVTLQASSIPTATDVSYDAATPSVVEAPLLVTGDQAIVTRTVIVPQYTVPQTVTAWRLPEASMSTVTQVVTVIQVPEPTLLSEVNSDEQMEGHGKKGHDDVVPITEMLD